MHERLISQGEIDLHDKVRYLESQIQELSETIAKLEETLDRALKILEATEE